MVSLLHPGVANRVEELHRAFDNAQPFRHVVIEPFLDPAFCEQLIAGFPSFDRKYALSEDGEVGGKAVISKLASLGPAYRSFDALMQDAQFLELTGRITGISKLLYDPEYIGGGTHENLHGQELDLHVDFNYHPISQLHRRLNLIVFLNPTWEDSWGGCLELVRDPFAVAGEPVETVAPLANRAVIFETTESSWHGFQRIQFPAGAQMSRRSIAVYFYTADRPETEAAPSHATIYYQRPMPSRLKPGYTLREEDVTEIETLLARRDGTIRFLYKREKQFSQALGNRDRAVKEALEDVTGSLSFRLGRALTAPARALRSILKRG